MNDKLSAFVEKVRSVSDKMYSLVSSLWATNRTLLLASCALIICIPLILIVVIGIDDSEPEAVKSDTTIGDYIYLPEEPGLGSDYVYSRNKQNHWTEEESLEWFVEPDGKMMNDMRTVNDRLINDLLEAVP
ncbi:MAG: hypothetical protein K5930_00025 [Treponemataceae bacterium]|nr:hypothetical protein [Treponemataceae bacterium]